MMDTEKDEEVETEAKTYTFAELLAASKDPDSDVTEKAVERARDWLSEGATDHQWWDYTYEMWKDALDEIGFTNADISFSGFCCQGDGASFTSGIDLERLIAFLALPTEPDECIHADKDGHEVWAPWLAWKLEGVATNRDYLDLPPLVEQSMLEVGVRRTESRYSHEMTCEFEGFLNDDGREAECDDYEWTGHGERMRDLAGAFFIDAEILRRALCHCIYTELEAEHEYLTSDEHHCETDDEFDEEGEHVDG